MKTSFTSILIAGIFFIPAAIMAQPNPDQGLATGRANPNITLKAASPLAEILAQAGILSVCIMVGGRSLSPVTPAVLRSHFCLSIFQYQIL